MASSPGSPATESRQGKNPSQVVSVNISEPNPDTPHRFHLEVSECVETRTITTTTRLTRKFPHVFDSNPTPLECLDTKEFPLAMKPTPPELLAFTYNMAASQDADGDLHMANPVSHLPLSTHQRNLSRYSIRPIDKCQRLQQVKELSSDRRTPTVVKTEPAHHDTPSHSRASRRSSRSPSEAYPRRSRQTRSAAASASASAERSSKALSDKLRRSLAHEAANSFANSNGCWDSTRQSRSTSGVLATPDASESVDLGADQQLTSRPRALQLDRSRNIQDTSPSQQASTSRNGAASPIDNDSQTIFGSNVATPPITDADVEPFADTEPTHQTARSQLHQPSRPSIDVAAAQDASLPSPRLSPTLAASRVHSNDQEDDGDNAESSFQTDTTGLASWADESQGLDNTEALALALSGSQDSFSRALTRHPRSTDDKPVIDPHMLLEAFDSMKSEMKTYMMYQFLRRCARPTLRVVANAVNPALKCDFFSQLPLELSYHILSYLNHRDLCRAAQVSKHWRNIVDRNETGWKELFDRDGFTLPSGELTKAITQGWGWQDPEGATGFERDLSMQSRLTSSEHELTRSVKPDPAPRPRTSKRKRGVNPYSASERTKRRASAQEAVSYRDDKTQAEIKQHKSAGPLSAANAAATTVPDPHLGLPSLRQLHLFKSLYRRHHMIRQSWTSGKVKPSHVAFAAHPRHVITCLQFDEDKIITGSDDTFIHVYDTKTGKLRNKLVGHEGGVWALQYEGNILVSGSTDRSVRVWDIERGICQQVFYGHTSTVRCLQILTPTQTGTGPDGQPIMEPEKPLIITGSRDSQLRVWRLPEVGSKRYIQNSLPSQESECPYFIRALSGHTHSVRAISAYGDTLVSGSYDSFVRVWRISTGECLHVLHGHSQKVYSVVLDHERNRCISGSMDSLVKIWDLTTGACLYTLEGHSLLVGLLDLRDERLVSAAADSTLRIWDPETGRCKNTLMAHTGAITCFQHDGRKVISGSEKTVKMWDIQTGECVQDLLTDLGGVWQVKFDGRRCVAAVQRDHITYVEVSAHFLLLLVEDPPAAHKADMLTFLSTRFWILALFETASPLKS